MLTGLIKAVIASILDTCGFLFNHTLKSIFIDTSSDPRLFFENDKKKVTIRVSDTASLENSLEERVNAEMEKDRKIYAPQPLDPYQNPWLAVQDFGDAARSLNNRKAMYLRSKEECIRRMFVTDIVDQKWQPIDIYIVNKGSIATKLMLIVITESNNNLYGSTKIMEDSGICYQPPTGKERFHKNIMPISPLPQSEYTYRTTTNDGPIPEGMRFDIKDPVRQGKNNRVKLATFYIDTSTAKEIIIKWNIYEDTLGKKGNHGVLKIECVG